MNVKSLLCAAAMLSVCGVAQAFPGYSLYPEEGNVAEAQYLTNIVLTVDGSDISVADLAYATLTNPEGKSFESTDFFKSRMESNGAIIWFEEDDIKVNGDWTLTIPAGSVSVNGEENPEIIANYVLNDPNLGLGEFPQIELVSINPPANDKLAVWGGTYFDKVTIKTTDDAAVNYIDWYLYDVTNGEEPGVAEYLLQGNDNRYDFNRYHHHDDIWTDGLYIAVASNEKLIEGHKYRLDLRFCGIGYNDATNQYPTMQQLTASTELETSVYYYGLTPGPEYSKYEYVSVIPDPASGYVISSMEWAHFLVTYSGPVKPIAFNYALAVGTAPAGKWTPGDGAEVDDEGYADAWEFIFDESVVKDATGTISVSIQSQDKDGLDVRGNLGTTFDDVRYMMDWECNLGAPALISVEPTDGSEVETLSSITVTNEKGLEMAVYYGLTPIAQISNRDRAVVRELGEPTISADGKQATWTFEPITDSDNYSLYISDKYFVLGEQFESYYTNATTFTYVVEGGNTPGDVTYDLMPLEITPANNSTVDEIGIVTLTFEDETYPTETRIDEYKIVLKEAELYMYNGSDYDLLTSVIPVDNPASDYFNPTIYDFTFLDENGAPFDADGQYKVVIPAGTFCTAEYFDTESGSLTPEIVLYYAIGGTVGVEAIVNGDKVINVYDLNGVQVFNNANVEAAKELKSGIYIINGKKVVIRR